MSKINLGIIKQLKAQEIKPLQPVSQRGSTTIVSPPVLPQEMTSPKPENSASFDPDAPVLPQEIPSPKLITAKSDPITELASLDYHKNLTRRLLDCDFRGRCIVEKDDKLLTLIIDPNLKTFIKILKRRIGQENVANQVDERGFVAISYRPEKKGDISSALVEEYETTKECLELQQDLQKDLDRKSLKYFLENWIEFSNQQKSLEVVFEKDAQTKMRNAITQWKDSVLHNHQQFINFLNGADYLKKFAQLGNVALKGSYLYGDLLALSPVKAQDIDLEISIPDLFLREKSLCDIKKIIEENLGFEVGEIKISKKYSYAQCEFMTADGTKVDLSFYDSNKMPDSDWIFGLDALRIDLCTILKLERPINCDDLLPIKPSLSAGFLKSHPDTKVDDVLLEKTHLINYEARDLLFNTIKRIHRGLLAVDQVASLYLTGDQFKNAIDKDWNYLILHLDKLPKKCENALITVEDFHKFRTQIITDKTPVISPTISASRPLQVKERDTTILK